MYKEIKSLNLQDIDQEILNFWETNKVFEKSIENKTGAENFVFYEGPPLRKWQTRDSSRYG
jgi:isoleucyl-tRNA synthetase